MTNSSYWAPCHVGINVVEAVTVRIAAFDLDTLVPAGEIPNVRANGAAVDAKSGHGFARVEQNLGRSGRAKTLTADTKTSHVLTMVAEFGPRLPHHRRQPERLLRDPHAVRCYPIRF
jgi:hypothetical protein